MPGKTGLRKLKPFRKVGVKKSTGFNKWKPSPYYEMRKVEPKPFPPHPRNEKSATKVSKSKGPRKPDRKKGK